MKPAGVENRGRNQTRSSGEELFSIVFLFKGDFLKMHHRDGEGEAGVGGCHDRERGSQMQSRTELHKLRSG